MKIKILGPGCARCNRVEQVARQAAAKAGLRANFVHVTDWASIMAYPIMGTPGLVINEELKCAGRIPQTEEVVAWMEQTKA